MYLIVDAWLERKEPQIRLIDAGRGEVVFRLGAGQVRALIDSGVLCIQDLEEDSFSCSELLFLMSERNLLEQDFTGVHMASGAGYMESPSEPAGFQPLP